VLVLSVEAMWPWILNPSTVPAGKLITIPNVTGIVGMFGDVLTPLHSRVNVSGSAVGLAYLLAYLADGLLAETSTRSILGKRVLE
jgi:hypothetical protein